MFLHHSHSGSGIFRLGKENYCSLFFIFNVSYCFTLYSCFWHVATLLMTSRSFLPAATRPDNIMHPLHRSAVTWHMTDFSFSFNAVPLGAPQHIVDLVVLHSILAACLCNMAPQRSRCVGSASTSAKCLPPHSARHFSDTFLQRTAPTDRRAHRLTSLTPWSEPCVTALQQSSPDSSL